MRNLRLLSGLLFMGLAFVIAPHSFAEIGFLKKEVTQGLTTTCYYDVLGDTFAKSYPSVQICPVSLNFNTALRPASVSKPRKSRKTQPQKATSPYHYGALMGKIGLLTGEKSGHMNKVCYYDVLGDTRTKNISAVSVCPITTRF